MTHLQLSSLAAKVRAGRNECLALSDAVTEFLRENPEVDQCEVYGAAMCMGRAPFPSVDGNPPVDRKRPYLDLRRFPERA